jgi:hypothetical protein
MYLSDLKVPYFKCLSSISIKVISMGTTLVSEGTNLVLEANGRDLAQCSLQNAIICYLL